MIAALQNPFNFSSFHVNMASDRTGFIEVVDIPGVILSDTAYNDFAMYTETSNRKYLGISRWCKRHKPRYLYIPRILPNKQRRHPQVLQFQHGNALILLNINHKK